MLATLATKNNVTCMVFSFFSGKAYEGTKMVPAERERKNSDKAPFQCIWEGEVGV